MLLRIRAMVVVATVVGFFTAAAATLNLATGRAAEPLTWQPP